MAERFVKTTYLGGNVLVVGNGCRYSTVASAITAASAGDTVLVTPGTYAETVVLTSGVNLEGWGMPTISIVQCYGNQRVRNVSGAFQVFDSGVVLRWVQTAGLTLSGSWSGRCDLIESEIQASAVARVFVLANTGGATLYVTRCRGTAALSDSGMVFGTSTFSVRMNVIAAGNVLDVSGGSGIAWFSTASRAPTAASTMLSAGNVVRFNATTSAIGFRLKHTRSVPPGTHEAVCESIGDAFTITGGGTLTSVDGNTDATLTNRGSVLVRGGNLHLYPTANVGGAGTILTFGDVCRQIDLSTGTVFDLRLGTTGFRTITGATTLTTVGTPQTCNYNVRLIDNGAGPHTVTWGTGFSAASTATTAGKITTVLFSADATTLYKVAETTAP